MTWYLPSNFKQTEIYSGYGLRLGNSIIPQLHPHELFAGLIGPFVVCKEAERYFFLTTSLVTLKLSEFTDNVKGTPIFHLLLETRKGIKCGYVASGVQRDNIPALIEICEGQRLDLGFILDKGFSGVSETNFPSYDNRDSRNMTQVYIFGKYFRPKAVQMLYNITKKRIDLYAPEVGLFMQGEGGAAVFLMDENRLLHCVGVFVGGIEDDPFHFVVFPIERILLGLERDLGLPLEILSFNNKSRRKEMSTITSLDQISLEMRDMDLENHWLETNDRPSKETLKLLTLKFGRKSEVVIKNCGKICSYVKYNSNNIADVVPTYTPKDKNNIVFVIIARDEVVMEKPDEYLFTIKYPESKSSQYGEEGKFVIHSTFSDNAKMTDPQKDKLKRIVSKNADKLMKKHKLLTAISGGLVRSKKYGSPDARLSKELCIVLYVLCKDYIPIDEKVFKKEYGGISIDVREGFFTPFAFTASSYLESMRMGCQIGRRQMVGTVGGFLECRGYGLCGLTCAHVLLDSSEMIALINNPNGIMNWQHPPSDNNVYQPNSDVNTQAAATHDHFAGKLIKAVYQKGGFGKTGIEVALFQVEKRYPLSGHFPTLQDGTTSEMQFHRGKVAGFSRLRFGRVKKFGAATDTTDGTIVMEAPILSVKYCKDFQYSGDYQMILHNLLEVKTLSVTPQGGIVPFADSGDSGALVFCDGNDGEMLCVGIIEGGITAGTVVVMPIMPILDILKVKDFTNFELENTKHEVENTKHEVENLKQQIEQLKQKINSN
ncbi:uncharacterized protein LOC132756836 isoform X2 [Ruditapes philippinarum]|uniref:uncharacterized protein LOC132756836 isoform X2 n=1 Tax=Ruditapes philippinarum TaxID=129788 RepID=UPI00295A7000|nr:uncharacterized protein LOC132756836 isoform X2 [Ruditapes philippinarum]